MGDFDIPKKKYRTGEKFKVTHLCQISSAKNHTEQ